MDEMNRITIDIGHLGDNPVVYQAIATERIRQRALWTNQRGDCSTLMGHDNDRALTILVEEVGELARAIMAENYAEMEQELIQVAAVAVAMLNGIGGYLADQ